MFNLLLIDVLAGFLFAREFWEWDMRIDPLFPITQGTFLLSAAFVLPFNSDNPALSRQRVPLQVPIAQALRRLPNLIVSVSSSFFSHSAFSEGVGVQGVTLVNGILPVVIAVLFISTAFVSRFSFGNLAPSRQWVPFRVPLAQALCRLPNSRITLSLSFGGVPLKGAPRP